MPDRPHTHTQYNDQSGDEPPCKGGIHHFVEDGEEGSFVCSRCGVVAGEDY